MTRTFGIDPTDTQPERWGVTVDGEEVRHLEAMYSGRVSDDELDSVRDRAADALSRCPNPTASIGRVTGLALGKIQSGKTLSYTALIALAIDNGYRITVVLTGTKNALLEQNYARLRHDLGTTRPNVTPFKNPTPAQDADVVAGVLHGGGHALIVLLKHRGRIDDAKRLLSSPELRGQPALIIDDEGDEASLNTQFRRGHRSAIYDSILRLRDTLQLHAYVAYTATPQANLLIQGVDGLSPDFGVLIEPGAGYCGGSIFFGGERDRYVRMLPAGEGDYTDAAEIPEGLKMALATFLVGGAIRHLRLAAAWHSMLIHNSNRRVDHERLQGAVRNLIGLWRETLDLPDTDPAAADLLALMRRAYDDLSTTVQNTPRWDEVSRQLRDEIRLEVWMVNSLPLGRDPIATPFRLKNNVLIGGNMLGRGVTIEELAVTYITRRAQGGTNADTMEQRARWFGYKTDYLDICRTFLTGQLCQDYTELLRHEDDFWDALVRSQRQSLSIRDWPRMFSLDMNLGLRPTRTAVANFRQFRASGWDIQNEVIQDQAIASRNVEVVRRFSERHPGKLRTYGNVQHLVVPACNTNDVISELLARLQSEGTDLDKEYTSEYLARLLLGGVLPTMDVLLMTNGEFRDRAHRDGRVVNLMQGRSPGRAPTDPDFYPGDREIHGGRVQLQVHLLRLRETGTETTALALYVPEDDQRYDLRYVVRD